MEWTVLVACALVAAALVARPWRRAAATPAADLVEIERGELAALLEERSMLLAELRELDDDAAAGRIAPEDRQAGRRALAPRLRAVTEALRARGVDAREGAS